MQCAECGFVESSVTPSDAAVALRSYPRRLRAVLVRPDDDNADDVVHRPASDGWSAVDHAVHLAASLVAVAEAVRLVSIEESPVVALAPERRVAGAESVGVDTVLADVEAACNAAAAAVERVQATDWERQGRVNDGKAMSALDLARHGVHEGIHHLRAAERAVREAVSGSG